MARKVDVYRATARLVANAVGTAKVMGESPRINRLVASSIGRYMKEMDATPGSAPGQELLDFALDCLQEQGPEHAPGLGAALRTLRPGEGA